MRREALEWRPPEPGSPFHLHLIEGVPWLLHDHPDARGPHGHPAFVDGRVPGDRTPLDDLLEPGPGSRRNWSGVIVLVAIILSGLLMGGLIAWALDSLWRFPFG